MSFSNKSQRQYNALSNCFPFAQEPLMRIAVIVLNRNLAKVTDKLCGKLLKEGVLTSDLFVIEAGSDDDNLSKYCTCMSEIKKLLI